MKSKVSCLTTQHDIMQRSGLIYWPSDTKSDMETVPLLCNNMSFSLLSSSTVIRKPFLLPEQSSTEQLSC